MYQPPKKPVFLPVVVPLGLLIVVSAGLSIGEFAYWLHARRAIATVDSAVLQQIGQGRGSRVFQAVEFHFRDAAGTDQRGRDLLAGLRVEHGPGEEIEVEYLPGRSGSTRVVGNGAKMMPAVFFFCLLCLAAVGAVLALERRGRHLRKLRRHREAEEREERALHADAERRHPTRP